MKFLRSLFGLLQKSAIQWGVYASLSFVSIFSPHCCLCSIQLRMAALVSLTHVQIHLFMFSSPIALGIYPQPHHARCILWYAVQSNAICNRLYDSRLWSMIVMAKKRCSFAHSVYVVQSWACVCMRSRVNRFQKFRFRIPITSLA